MKKAFALLIIILILSACAQQNQPLTGGPKDTIPPKLVKSLPPLKDTSFLGDKIILKFDEFFVLKNLNNVFFSSPPFAKTPNFKISGKKLIIKPKEKLRDSATYTFYFGNAIADYHENNILKNYQFIFSTYNKIDSLKISGTVKDAYTKKPIPNILVALYKKNIDSIVFKSLPIYVAKTDSSGSFSIKNIQTRYFKIFAFEDLNNNYKLDPDESNLAFLNHTIKPSIKITQKIDTLDSGNVFYKSPLDTIPDTLSHDTIIITKKIKFLPNNINLRLFKELASKQNIIRKKRKQKGFVKLFFTIPLIKNYFLLMNMNGNAIDTNQFKIEKFTSKDSIYIWFLSPNFYSHDSLNFLIQYFQVNKNLTTDTVSFYGYDYSTDTIPIKISVINKNISLNTKINLQTETPIKKIDTNKIKLFQLVDTIVSDEKIQNLKVIRPESDSLIFIFTRPVNKFSIKFLNYKDIPNLYSYSKNKNNDSVFCKITNKNIIKQDTIKCTVFYDNLYFYNQYQYLDKKLKIPVTEQKILKITRKQQDSIKLTFSKNINKNIKIKIINAPDSNYIYTIKNNKLFIFLKKYSLYNLDTLKFRISVYDKKLYNGLNKYTIDTIKAIYTYDKQKIIYKKRYSRGNIIIAFKKSLLNIPSIKLLSFKPFRKWYTLRISRSEDTIFIRIKNQRVLRLNNIHLKIAYIDINQHNDTLRLADTLNLKVEKIETKNTKIIGHEKKLSLKKPIKFTIKKQKKYLRRYTIFANYLAGKNYLLKIDSAAFTDIFDHCNDSTTNKINVYSPENFAQISINIKNIWAVLDTITPADTSANFQLKKGKLILQIEDEKGNIKNRMTLKSEKSLKNSMILPGKYLLRLIYDENNNNIWDTGNYLKHIQPEKVFIYKDINLSKGDQKTIDWNLEKQK
jgi:hypothetical protein